MSSSEVRWRGHFLADARDAPAAVLQVLAAQIGVLPMPRDDYPRDDKTRSAHLERIRQYLGFVRCDRTQRQRLLAYPHQHGARCAWCWQAQALPAH